MLRHSQGFGQRLRSLAWPQQRKLFLLVFLWTCLCFLLFRSAFLGSGTPYEAHVIEQPGEPERAGAAPQPQPQQQNVISAPPAGEPTSTQALSNTNKQTRQAHDQAAAASTTPRHEANASGPPANLSSPSARPSSPPANSRSRPAKCAYEYPNLAELQFNNIYWQKFTRHHAPAARNATGAPQQATYYLYSAYYDDRWRGGLPSVRVLAMIDRVQPPATDCLLWSRKLPGGRPLVTRAQFLYAWYPKWGNYEDGLLQPWIVSCVVPREHVGLVPDSVTLAEPPSELSARRRRRRQSPPSANPAPVDMPAAYSSSSAASPSEPSGAEEDEAELDGQGQPLVRGATPAATRAMQPVQYDCSSALALTNNLPVINRRPPGGKRDKFAVCVKGLDFPHDDVSHRLVEWIELLSLLGAKKIFLYQLDVHKNISKVLDYYQELGLVELSPLTLPGEQPNLPEYQHLYLKQKLTTKRQNELIPYNDCLYRNLYSYEYLALLDIDEIIMPLKEEHSSWHDLMGEVERRALAEQNYSRASYNVRNVYFFDDLSGPLGTTQAAGEAASEATGDPGSPGGQAAGRESLERGIPHHLHMMSHVYRSKNYTEPGQYVKCFHNTERVVSLHNHFPMNCFGQCTTYSIPVQLAHLQHYRKDCVGPLRQSCKNDFRHFTTRDTTIWKFKQRMIRRTTRVLSQLELLAAKRR